MTSAAPIKVLIVDDSAMVRRVLTTGLATDPQIEVVGAASSADAAWTLMQELRPDVVTLDIEMPGTDGLTFLKTYLKKLPIPTVVISSLTREGAQVTLRAMEAGAVDIVAKPTLGLGDGLPSIMSGLCARVRAAAKARVIVGGRKPPQRTMVQPPPVPTGNPSLSVIALGASTGGVQALCRILPLFPADSPGVVVVQHMPEGFTSAFAQRLDSLCAMTVREAQDGDLVRNGLVLLAPGGSRHMGLVRRGMGLCVILTAGEPVCFSRPSVDALFVSVARVVGPNAVAALLTGMGRDGANGLLAIRKAGGRTLTQDEATSVVYGMPMAANELGASEETLPLDAIPNRLLTIMPNPQAKARA
jgi:two-component system, chemotaxis family, protein-glutamate methylesterase/glutaminase